VPADALHGGPKDQALLVIRGLNGMLAQDIRMQHIQIRQQLDSGLDLAGDALLMSAREWHDALPQSLLLEPKPGRFE